MASATVANLLPLLLERTATARAELDFLSATILLMIQADSM